MQQISDFVIYHDPKFYAAFPAAISLDDSRILVFFRRARDLRRLQPARIRADDPCFSSIDHVDSRSEVVQIELGPDLAVIAEAKGLPVNPEAADQDASVLALRDGRLLLSGFSWYPFPASHRHVVESYGGGYSGDPESGCLFMFWGGYTRSSADAGRSWSPHRYLPPVPDLPDLVPGKRPHFGGALRGRGVEAPDGTLLLPAYAALPANGYRHAGHLMASRDGGETWHFRARMAVDPEGHGGFTEPALHLTPSGRLLALHRTVGLDDRLAVVESEDLGESWGPWRLSGVRGHPCDLQPLRDGRLLLVYGYRHKPYGIRARIIDGEGRNLDSADEIVIRDDGPSPDLGYPWATELADGRVLVVYYLCDALGTRHIAGSVLAI